MELEPVVEAARGELAEVRDVHGGAEPVERDPDDALGGVKDRDLVTSDGVLRRVERILYETHVASQSSALRRRADSSTP